MKNDDVLAEYSELLEEQCSSLPVIMPRGVLLDDFRGGAKQKQPCIQAC